MRIVAAFVALVAFATFVAPAARAEEPKHIGVGLYAPSAPFEGPEARLAFVTEVAEHLAAKTGRAVVGRVFARAADLVAAVKKGEIQVVVIDAPNAATSMGGGYEVLGLAVRSGGGGSGGGTTAAWELIATNAIRDLRDLRGKTVTVPTVSGHETPFLLNALLEGEVAPGYFGKVTSAPDALSAAAAVSIGRADAAVVPGGLTLPAGTHRVALLRDVPWPALAIAPGVDDSIRRAFAAALPSFRSSGSTFARFEAYTGGSAVPFTFALASTPRRGPMAVPAAARLEVKGVLAGRTFAIEPTDLTPLVEAPGRK
jgi:ABC-type amino acid transport substrate-binding protein